MIQGPVMHLKSSLRFRERRSLRKSNDRRSVITGPHTPARGEAIGNAVLTEDDVRRILSLKRPGVGARKIIRALGLLGVSEHTVSAVLAGRTWRHVSPGG